MVNDEELTEPVSKRIRHTKDNVLEEVIDEDEEDRSSDKNVITEQRHDDQGEPVDCQDDDLENNDLNTNELNDDCDNETIHSQGDNLNKNDQNASEESETASVSKRKPENAADESTRYRQNKQPKIITLRKDSIIAYQDRPQDEWQESRI